MLATHLITGAYGFWLPNDPRGSWSDYVGSYELAKFGPATKTDARHSVAGHPHDRAARLATKKALKHAPVLFTGIQARAIGRGFAQYISSAEVICHAFAILPDHVHLVLEDHRLTAESLMVQLKGAASKQMLAEQIHPFQNHGDKRPKCFARGQWKVFLNTPDDVRRAIDNVERNPIKDGKPRQNWSFVTAYDATRSAARRG